MKRKEIKMNTELFNKAVAIAKESYANFEKEHKETMKMAEKYGRDSSAFENASYYSMRAEREVTAQMQMIQKMFDMDMCEVIDAVKC